MGVSKRPRDTEDSLPLPKQSKIGDFYSTQVPIRNRFEVLADNDNVVGSNSPINNNGNSVDHSKDKVCLTSLPKINSGVTDNTKDSDCSLADLCSLVARTLELMWNNLASLHSKLDHLTYLHKNQGIDADGGRPCALVSSLRPHPSQKTAACSACNLRLDPAWHLILQPRKICLTICSFRGQTPSWNSKFLVSRHLKSLLATKQVDLESVELLNNTNQALKVLLTFSSTKIPQLLLTRKSSLCSKGVFPVRVFQNISVAPLFPSVSIATWSGQRETTTKSTSKPAVAIQGNSTPPNKALPNDLINWTEPVESPRLLGENPVGQPDLEGDLLAAYKNLSTTEQQLITARLEELKSCLLSYHNKNEKCLTPPLLQNSTTMPTCPMPTQSSAGPSKRLIEVEAEIHPLLDSGMASPMQPSVVNLMHPPPEALPGSSFNNGCINFDFNNSLDQLIETD